MAHLALFGMSLILIFHLACGRPMVTHHRKHKKTNEIVEQFDQKRKFFETLIAGGSDAFMGDYRYYVSLVNEKDQTVFCGGTIIDERWVLTAAHCIDDYIDGKMKFWIESGSINRNMGTKNSVTDVIEHPGWNGMNNDIALIRTQKSIFGDGMSEAIQIWGSSFDEGDKMKIMGFGNVSEYDQFGSSRLQSINISAGSKDQCNAANGGEYPEGYFCGGGLEKGGACAGDSGGPAVITSGEDGLEYLAGLVSFGGNDVAWCDQDEAWTFFVDAAYYLSWIEESTGIPRDQLSHTSESPETSAYELHEVHASFQNYDLLDASFFRDEPAQSQSPSVMSVPVTVSNEIAAPPATMALSPVAVDTVSSPPLSQSSQSLSSSSSSLSQPPPPSPPPLLQPSAYSPPKYTDENIEIGDPQNQKSDEEDFREISCAGFCSQTTPMNFGCNCDQACIKYNDCCGDYFKLCVAHGIANDLPTSLFLEPSPTLESEELTESLTPELESVTETQSTNDENESDEPESEAPTSGLVESDAPQVGSCRGLCGGSVPSSFSCSCDHECIKFSDCCDDFEELCANSCAGHCDVGKATPGGCWCNMYCVHYGDCCVDYSEHCLGSKKTR